VGIGLSRWVATGDFFGVPLSAISDAIGVLGLVGGSLLALTHRRRADDMARQTRVGDVAAGLCDELSGQWAAEGGRCRVLVLRYDRTRGGRWLANVEHERTEGVRRLALAWDAELTDPSYVTEVIDAMAKGSLKWVDVAGLEPDSDLARLLVRDHLAGSQLARVSSSKRELRILAVDAVVQPTPEQLTTIDYAARRIRAILRRR